MKRTLFALMLAAAASMPLAAGASAQMMGGGNKMSGDGNPMVGGAPMFKAKNIVENAVNSADHTTLVAAVKAAGLVETLQGKGPFTVFAPTNAAFEKLPAGTVETLVRPENKDTLTKILTYHVVAGRYDSKKLAQLIKKGGTSNVQIADVYQSNGVIHVIDTVVMPR